MSKRERNEAISEMTSRVFSEMFEEILMDVVLQSHQEIARSRVTCKICHTRCGAVHVPPTAAGSLAASSSRVSTPSTEARPGDTNGLSGTGTNTPVGGKEANILCECVNCKRQIASNRYAPHLGNCMGLGNRRGTARMATAKTKLASDAGRSDSPYLGSEAGNLSDESKTATKGKGKSKAKRTEDAEFSMNRKRPASPSVSPQKKGKKQKNSGSPVARVKTDPDALGITANIPPVITNSQSKIPSKLRDSSFVSSTYYEQRSSSPESRSSSPARSESTMISHSPSLAANAIKAKQKKMASTAATFKQPSPPRPLPPTFRMPEPDYLVDVEGDETGSSTDTDSS